MLISRAVTVKSRVTPSLRAQLGAETQKAIREVEQEMAERERRRALSRGADTAALDKELQELSARREALASKLKDVARLREGQEVTRGQIQGFGEVKVGDIWSHVQSCDIVLEDGRVVAIREGAAVTVTIQPESAALEEPER